MFLAKFDKIKPRMQIMKKTILYVAAVILVILAVMASIKIFSQEDDWICVDGQWQKHGAPLAPMPSSGCGSPQATPTSLPAKNILVSSPLAGVELSLPFEIEGRARVFESTVNFKIKDKDDNVLYEGIGMAQSPDAGQFGLFNKEISYLYQKPASPDVTLEVFELSAKDGSVINLVSVPVKLNAADARTVKIFYLNSNLDPENSCEKVFPVERIISQSGSLIENTLKALFGEMNPADVEKGYDTVINPGVFVQSWSLKDDVARVDFNDALEAGGGGSCRVAAIRHQIIETLKQFSSVKEVIISINGRTEDILQP